MTADDYKGGGGDADHHLAAAHSFVDGQVHAQFGDPAIKRVPVAAWIATAQEGVERVDRLLPGVQPVPVFAGSDGEGEFEPDRPGWQLGCADDPVIRQAIACATCSEPRFGRNGRRTASPIGPAGQPTQRRAAST
jgi:hypothetical protein